ncbi:hypothetical protein DFA_11840 [Cavenderia fasciculata]|uniref:Immunity protein Imm33 domain-containing protein n=1 Tax=Cavenderia fasciculata TaxID=261658 RepID=F4QED0_CACFS|nr:uncharacterized protein DFA_11840 [Cavenderia fasciculata]EGG14077.1 hypothetical protein DFA_11840 [Cavenderia fasciculata]|eukprot:XP_004350785.1 hypothetical protein DFA_11840 [Cavenderia fasciculata]
MFELEDVVTKNNLYKYTFTIPSKNQIEALQPGDLVKLIFKQQDPGSGGNRTPVETFAGNVPLSSPYLNSLRSSFNGVVGSPQSCSPQQIPGVNGATPSGNGTTTTSAAAAPAVERMWVIIQSINPDRTEFIGALDNSPVAIGIAKGDASNDTSSYMTEETKNYISQSCLVSNKIIHYQCSAGYIFREEPNHASIIPNDSGWRIFQGEESTDYISNKQNVTIVQLASVLNVDDSFIDFLEHSPNDSFYERKDPFKPWTRIK